MTVSQFIPYELDLRIVQMMSEEKIRIPAYPAIALRLKELVLSDTFAMSQLVEVVERDPSLAATVLRYASSAAVRGQSRVESLHVAIGRIGAEGLVRLAFTAGIGASFKRASSLSVLRRRIWRQSLAAGEICRELAPARGLDPNTAFLAGLLHDFGKAVALSCIEELLPRRAKVREAHCIKVMDLYHVELGSVLAHRWKLPNELRDAIGRHHRPDDDPLVQLVALSDKLVEAFEGGSDTLSRLTDIDELSDAERQQTLRVLQDLPEILLAYAEQSASPVSRRADGPLERESSTLDEPRVPVRYAVSCAGKRYQTMFITPDGLAISSPRPLPEEEVLKVLIEPDRGLSLELWVVVSLCREQHGKHTVELKPTSLDERGAQRWQRLLEGARAA